MLVFLSLSRSASIYIHKSESLIQSVGRLGLPVHDKPLPLNATSIMTVSTQDHIFLLLPHYCSYCYTGDVCTTDLAERQPEQSHQEQHTEREL